VASGKNIGADAMKLVLVENQETPLLPPAPTIVQCFVPHTTVTVETTNIDGTTTKHTYDQ
jgi:hypothetical protein